MTVFEDNKPDVTFNSDKSTVPLSSHITIIVHMHRMPEGILHGCKSSSMIAQVCSEAFTESRELGGHNFYQLLVNLSRKDIHICIV